MNRILGIVLIFAAAWLMFKLQAGSGSNSCGENESSGTDQENRLGCCGDTNLVENCKEGDGVEENGGPEKGRKVKN